MSARVFACVLYCVSGIVAGAKAEVVVELVPDQPGPYVGDDSLTVDVWLHSQVSFDLHVWGVRLDFTDSDRQLGLDPTFTFDLSSSIVPEDFDEVHPELPIPWAANLKEYACDGCRLQLPAGGSLHIGSIGVKLPTELGTYRLDALNADDPDRGFGASIDANGIYYWRAFTGEITGGAYPFVVIGPAIPTVSEWGIIAMGLLLLVLGCLMIIRRTRRAKGARLCLRIRFGQGTAMRAARITQGNGLSSLAFRPIREFSDTA